MGRLITLMCLFIIGCNNNPVRLRTEIQETFVPVLYCPAPDIHERPILAISIMTPDQHKNPGEVAKHYQATIQQLLGYSKELELELQKYDISNEAYDDLRKKMEMKFINDGTTTKEQLDKINPKLQSIE